MRYRHGDYVPDPDTLDTSKMTPEEIGIACADWVMFGGMNKEQVAWKKKMLNEHKWSNWDYKGDTRVDSNLRREVCIEEGNPGTWVGIAE